MTVTQKDITTLLVSDNVWERHGDAIRALSSKISPVIYEGNDVLPDEVIETLDAVFYSSDLWPDRSRGIVLSILKAQNIKWMHTLDAASAITTLSHVTAVTTTDDSTGLVTVDVTMKKRFPLLGRWLPSLSLHGTATMMREPPVVLG